MKELNIIKIGSAIIDDKLLFEKFLYQFESLNGMKILIHGGGKKATKWSKKMKIPIKIIDGRRITNLKTLELITGVYAGQINKDIVSKLQCRKINAIGISGVDGNLIESVKRPVKKINYGYVGDIIKVNSKLLLNLLNIGCIPVISPLTHDNNGQILNTNADTIACEIAISLSKKFNVNLYYCFDMKGIMKSLNDPKSLIENIDKNHYKFLLNNNILSKGILPKTKTAFYALENGVKKVLIGQSEMINNKIKHTKIIL
ncbi:MAG: acetylglutamate kinase [Flavobacteriaceae bacterium]|nr:acetylglutamate kinase [Flavobacteriaceae bacterium]